MKLLPLIATTMLIPLSGCLLRSDFKAPPTDIPSSWNQTTDAASAWPDTQWWQAFGSPMLNTQIEVAQANNYDLKAAIARIRQADAQARISGASLLPNVSASANATRTKEPGSAIQSSG